MRWLLALVVMLLAAVVATNAWVDPLQLTPSSAFVPDSRQTLSRGQQARLLVERPHAPEVLVLGSSTARNIDPHGVSTALGLGVWASHNASVRAGRPEEALALWRLARHRHERDSAPSLLFMCDVDGMLTEAPPNGGLTREADLWSRLPPRARAVLLVRVARSLVAGSTLGDSITAVRAGPVEVREAPISFLMRRDGFRQDDVLAEGHEEAQLAAQIAQYRRQYYPTPGARPGVDQLELELLAELVAAASDAPREPIVVLMPAHSEFERAFGDDRQRQLVEVRRAVRDVVLRHGGRFVDLSSRTRARVSDDDFLDGLHLTVAASDRLARTAMTEADWITL